MPIKDELESYVSKTRVISEAVETLVNTIVELEGIKSEKLMKGFRAEGLSAWDAEGCAKGIAAANSELRGNLARLGVVLADASDLRESLRGGLDELQSVKAIPRR